MRYLPPDVILSVQLYAVLESRECNFGPLTSLPSPSTVSSQESLVATRLLHQLRAAFQTYGNLGYIDGASIRSTASWWQERHDVRGDERKDGS